MDNTSKILWIFIIIIIIIWKIIDNNLNEGERSSWEFSRLFHLSEWWCANTTCLTYDSLTNSFYCVCPTIGYITVAEQTPARCDSSRTNNRKIRKDYLMEDKNWHTLFQTFYFLD